MFSISPLFIPIMHKLNRKFITTGLEEPAASDVEGCVVPGGAMGGGTAPGGRNPMGNMGKAGGI